MAAPEKKGALHSYTLHSYTPFWMLVSQYAGSDTFKNLEETMHVQVGDLSQDSTFDLFEFLSKFFSKI